MTEPSNTSSLEEITSQIDANIEHIDSLIPEDPIAKATGAKVGTEEHLEQGELFNKVKETNSTKRVNRILTVLRWVGYIGLFISSIIKFTGIVYDIDFHVPFLKEVIGEVGIASLGFFIALIIIIMTHLTSDGIVNNKWKTLPRITLIWLAMLGLSASFYFDYRAINNYTNVVVEKIKAKKIQNTDDSDGVAVQGVDDSTALLKTNLALYQSQIQTAQNRIVEIAEQRGVINDGIERVKTQKESTKSNKEIRKLNQNIYTSRKQLEELTSEEQRLSSKQSELMEQIATIQKGIQTQANKKGALLKNVDNKMSKDQFDRLIFLFVLVIFIEITSFGGLLADFLGNKNLEEDLKAQLDQLNNNTNTMSVLRGHLTAAEVRQARDFDRELTIRGTISDVHALSSIASMHRLAQNTKGFAQATHRIGEATNEVTQMAVEGIASNIRANLANQRVKKLEELVVEEYKDE